MKSYEVHNTKDDTHGLAGKDLVCEKIYKGIQAIGSIDRTK